MSAYIPECPGARVSGVLIIVLVRRSLCVIG